MSKETLPAERYDLYLAGEIEADKNKGNIPTHSSRRVIHSPLQVLSLDEIQPGRIFTAFYNSKKERQQIPVSYRVYEMLSDPYRESNTGSLWVRVTYQSVRGEPIDNHISLADYGVIPYGDVQSAWNQKWWLEWQWLGQREVVQRLDHAVEGLRRYLATNPQNEYSQDPHYNNK